VTIRSADETTEILGLSDGLCSSLGLVLTLALWGSVHGLVLATVSGAASASASMAGATWLSQRPHSVRQAGIMAFVTLIAWAPAIPFYFGRGLVNYLACGTLVAVLATLVAHIREEPAPGCYVTTFAVLGLATVVGLGCGALV
jgi:hypothetical protein